MKALIATRCEELETEFPSAAEFVSENINKSTATKASLCSTGSPVTDDVKAGRHPSRLNERLDGGCRRGKEHSLSAAIKYKRGGRMFARQKFSTGSLLIYVDRRHGGARKNDLHAVFRRRLFQLGRSRARLPKRSLGDAVKRK